jgi:hypothetical protein
MAEDASADTSVLTIKRLNSASRPPKKGTRVTAMPVELLAEGSLDLDEQAAPEPIE